MSPSSSPLSRARSEYSVELLFESAPGLDGSAVVDALARHAPSFHRVEQDAWADGLLFGDDSGQVPATTRWSVTPATVDREAIDAARRQTWWFDDGRELAGRSEAALVVADRMVGELDYRLRLELFQRLLVALIESHPSPILHWPASQHIVSSQELVETMIADGYSNPLPGALNVRFFRIDSAASAETLMDTVGLEALGLTDLQCHYRGLEPGDVSRVLYTTACHIFDHGTVIGEGNAVPGASEKDRWLCRHGEALAPPARPIIDLDPGFPFKAGVDEEDYVLGGDASSLSGVGRPKK